MRPALLLGGIVGVFTTVLPGQAQGPPALPGQPQRPSDVRTITLREVQVRSGPSDKFYPTSKLVYGDKVEVVAGPPGSQQPGWLAIKPPRGSFSWINKRFIQEIGADKKTGIVVTDENTPVPILVGSSETRDQPNKEAIKARRGSQVIFLGTPNYTDNGVWLPIQPQPDEVRYLPESAVQPSTLAPPVAAGYPNPTAPRTSGAPGSPVVGPVAGPVAADPNEDLRRLLQQRASAETDPARRQKILEALATLPAPSSAGVQLPGHPGNVVATANAGGLAAAGTMSMYATGNNAAAQPSVAGAARWSSWGELRRTVFHEADGRAVYALEDGQGHVLLYATALPNFSLDCYLRRKVTLYGPVTYDQEVRTNMMTVSHVSLMPAQNPY